MQGALEIFQFILGALYAHPYLFIFAGLIFAGELVLLPSIYLATTGRLELTSVVALAVVATLISDFIWYGMGRSFPASALNRIPQRRAGALVRGLEKLFARKGPHILFMSKFVYGTRIAAQILSGIHHMPLRTYFIANTLGVIAVTGSLVVIAYSVIGSMGHLGELMDTVEIAFVVFVPVVVLGQSLIGSRLRRQWSQ